MINTFRFYGPILRLFPPEIAHELTIRALSLGLAPKVKNHADPALVCRVFEKELPNPLGMAAGFDKDAEVIEPLFDLGFGFVEVGTVTPQAQPGNPRPRMFRLRKERAVINRMGFNNNGLAAFTGRLGRFRAIGNPVAQAVVGVNLGKNKTAYDAAADYISGIKATAKFADFFVINISSPNTPGLRDLQNYDSLMALLERIQTARGKIAKPPPLFVKIAPDLAEQDCEDIARAMLQSSVDGLVISNTTIQRMPNLDSRWHDEKGGLSGPPLTKVSTALIRRMYGLTDKKITIIGVGGVASGKDAYEKIKAGATLIELYTSMIYAGPIMILNILQELKMLMKLDGYTHISQAIGVEP
ncbi:MAG: quinone-dependent dihydroorotate dehydrogenase [Deltaproteobacteria bacterium]|nr:quinone-dependent dihydroorotate dehydrogenase [Deltaproteobacteria bacterium]